MNVDVLLYKRLKKLIALATVFSFLCAQSFPVMAYSPIGGNAGLNDVRAMFYLRAPLGASRERKDGLPSLNLTVQNRFQINDPVFYIAMGPSWGPKPLTMKAMDLRVRLDGKRTLLSIVGQDAINAGTILRATDEGIADEENDLSTGTKILFSAGALALSYGLLVLMGSIDDGYCESEKPVPYC